MGSDDGHLWATGSVSSLVPSGTSPSLRILNKRDLVSALLIYIKRKEDGCQSSQEEFLLSNLFGYKGVEDGSGKHCWHSDNEDVPFSF